MAAVLGSGGPLPGAPPSRLAGELDAGGLVEAVAREKGRVVLVNFWATWCVPCREEFPLLSRLQTRHRRSGLSVLGVSTDFQKETAAVEMTALAAGAGPPANRMATRVMFVVGRLGASNVVDMRRFRLAGQRCRGERQSSSYPPAVDSTN